MNYTGWLVALVVVVLSIVGLAVWDYNTEDRPNQTATPGEPTQTPPTQYICALLNAAGRGCASQNVGARAPFEHHDYSRDTSAHASSVSDS